MKIALSSIYMVELSIWWLKLTDFPLLPLLRPLSSVAYHGYRRVLARSTEQCSGKCNHASYDLGVGDNRRKRRKNIPDRLLQCSHSDVHLCAVRSDKDVARHVSY